MAEIARCGMSGFSKEWIGKLLELSIPLPMWGRNIFKSSNFNSERLFLRKAIKLRYHCLSQPELNYSYDS